MAKVAYSLIDCDSLIRLKVECVASGRKYNLIHSEIKEDSESVSESNALEHKLDIDELQEIFTMCTRPSVRTFILQLITQLETVNKKIP
jgi:hypothetical protein